MYPRSSLPSALDPTDVPPSAVTHAHVARKLLYRAVRHLKQAEAVEKRWPPGDDSRLLQQALERLAVADLLIDAYTTPVGPGSTSEHQHEHDGVRAV